MKQLSANVSKSSAAKAVLAFAMAALLAILLSAAGSQQALASTDMVAGSVAQEQAAAAPAKKATAASIKKTAIKDAKLIIKKAKATSGSSKAKLKKIYTYIAKNKDKGGTYESTNILPFWSKYGEKYYHPDLNKVKNTLFKKWYCKYAADMYSMKKGSCYHYAALFAVAAKQALGSKATVKLAAGSSKHTGELNKYHAWVEVKLGSKTYIYDPQVGNYTTREADKATSFGAYCGSLKSKLKKNYNNYKGAKYTTVKL